MNYRRPLKLVSLAIVGLWFAGANLVQSGESPKQSAGKEPATGTKTSTDEVFFNGKDFEGWEGLFEFWTVKDQAIIGATPKGLKFNTFLCSKKKYGDFELKLQVKMNKTGNSGIQIRSQIHNAKTFAVAGPQCDMGDPYWWGCLYGEEFGGMMKAADKEIVKKALKSEQFNDYYIRVVGKHVTIKLNGQTTVDDDFPKMADTGIIAWQLHAGGPMEVIFKNIQFTPIATEKK